MAFRLGTQGIDRARLRVSKFARQHRLLRAGVCVPDGTVLESPQDTAALSQLCADLLTSAPLIVRSATADEDSETTSRAGLGRSISDMREPAALHREVTALWHEGADQILVQQQIQRQWLIVAAADPGAAWHIEVHGPRAGPTPLADSRTPIFAGPPHRWRPESMAHSAMARFEQLLVEMADSGLRDSSPLQKHTTNERDHDDLGVDLELVIDPNGLTWIVQIRPLVAALSPGWIQFSKAVELSGGSIPPRGTLMLDGEHNPAPLSPAHQWLMRWLASQRPTETGQPLVLAGWLYLNTLPRDLDPPRKTSKSAFSASEMLHKLRVHDLPQAREDHIALGIQLEAVQIASTDALVHLRTGLERAQELFLAMIDLYVGQLIPARQSTTERCAARPHNPLSLLDRSTFADVLPAVWDLASPALGELFTPSASATTLGPNETLDPAVAATLLGEWDDHLFALGLAPLRSVWLCVARLLALDHDDVFLLSANELLEWVENAAARGPGPRSQAELVTLESRRRTQSRFDALQPPHRILDGLPEITPREDLLHGVPTGPSFTGRLAQRRDLTHLLADPPDPTEILCIPTLTAQAAMVLDHLDLRAVCTEYGGALSHGTLMARELKISALIGCRSCTRVKPGTYAHLDTHVGRLKLLIAAKSGT